MGLPNDKAVKFILVN